MANKRPSGWMYVVAALVMAGGCGASIGGAIWHSLSGIADMQRVIIPGSHELELESGVYTIYWESRSVVDGVAHINPGHASVRCGMNTASGESVDIRNANISQKYTFGSYQGESLFEVELARSGTYRLSCEVSGGTTSEGVLALGPGMSLGGIMFGVIGALLAFGIGLFIILRTYSRRKPPAQYALSTRSVHAQAGGELARASIEHPGEAGARGDGQAGR